MPRKKRQNVPYHRKRHRTPAKQNIGVADHDHALTNENTIAENCLYDEFDETLDNKLDTSDDIENVLVLEEQYIDIECTTTVYVDPFTELKKKVLQFVDMPYVCNPNCENIQNCSTVPIS